MSPRTRDAAAPPDLAPLRLRLGQLVVQAGLGADAAQLARSLAVLWQEYTSATGQGRELVSEIAVGCCAIARWLDPVRSVQAVPPLCAVVWHVGALRPQDGTARAWLDFLIPSDGRHAEACAWATDIQLLLAHAGIPVQAESILIDPMPGEGPAKGTVPTTDPLRVWGCQSLFHLYQSSVERDDTILGCEHGLRRRA
jgi:hypothetical protein